MPIYGTAAPSNSKTRYDVNMLNFLGATLAGKSVSYDLSHVDPLATEKQIKALREVLEACSKHNGWKKTENAFNEESPINRDGSYFIHGWGQVDFDYRLNNLKKQINEDIELLKKYLPAKPH